jgi:hypothetical protein
VHRLQSIAVDIGKHEAGSLASKQFGCRAAYAGCGTRYHRTLAS